MKRKSNSVRNSNRKRQGRAKKKGASRISLAPTETD